MHETPVSLFLFYYLALLNIMSMQATLKKTIATSATHPAFIEKYKTRSLDRNEKIAKYVIPIYSALV